MVLVNCTPVLPQPTVKIDTECNIQCIYKYKIAKVHTYVWWLSGTCMTWLLDCNRPEVSYGESSTTVDDVEWKWTREPGTSSYIGTVNRDADERICTQSCPFCELYPVSCHPAAEYYIERCSCNNQSMPATCGEYHQGIWRQSLIHGQLL